MPSKSPAQARLMRARAHGWKPDRIKGPSVKVAKEFVAADKKAKGMLFGGLFKSGLFTSGSTKTKTGKFFKKFLAEQEKEKADVAAITRPWEKGEGPLWDETIYPIQGKNRELVGPRTATSPPLDPSQYLIHLNPVGKDFEGEVDTSGYWGHALDAARIAELKAQGYTAMTGRDSGYFTPPTGRTWDPTTQGGLAEAAPPERTIDPVPGREFISGDAPPRGVGPPARTAAEIAPGFQPGRVPPSLLAYLERARAAAGEEEPVKMQFGGAMRGMMQRGRRGRRGMRGRGQPPGGGGLARAAVQPGGGLMTSDMGMRAGQARRGQPTRPPGGGVPLRGVGRPPGMGRPGAGGAQPGGRAGIGMGMPGGGGPGGVRPAVMPGRGFMPGGGGGAGRPGGASSLQGLMQQMRQQKMQQTGGGRPRIGAGDQQGAQARALQVQTGRPPMSRRQGFPGRGGRGRSGGRGRFRR